MQDHTVRSAMLAFYDELRDVRQASEHTQRAYRRELDGLHEWLTEHASESLSLGLLSHRMLRGYVAHRAENAAASSLARCIAALRA